MNTEIKAELDRIESNIAATYAAAEEQGANIPETKNTDNLPGTVSSIKSVKFTKQELTEEQQKQARDNIGAVSVDDIGTAAGAYYEQDEEPEDAPVGSFWMDTDDETNSAQGGSDSSGGNVDLGVTGATVGQTVKISAVDENGVPTAWLPADFPSDEHINGLINTALGVIENGTY